MALEEQIEELTNTVDIDTEEDMLGAGVSGTCRGIAETCDPREATDEVVRQTVLSKTQVRGWYVTLDLSSKSYAMDGEKASRGIARGFHGAMPHARNPALIFCAKKDSW